MATNGLSNVFATVSVPKPEYEELVRDSEQLEIIKRMVLKNKYIGQSDLKTVLNIEVEKTQKENQTVVDEGDDLLSGLVGEE